MARKRMIDPSIWIDDGMAQLTPRQQLLFIGLFSNADDEGRLKGSTTAVRLTLPTLYGGVADDEVAGDLAAVLGTIRHLVRYVVEGREYLAVTNFNQWQRIDHPVPSRLPAPPSFYIGVLCDDSAADAAPDASAQGILAEDSANPRRVLDEPSPSPRGALVESSTSPRGVLGEDSASPRRVLTPSLVQSSLVKESAGEESRAEGAGRLTPPDDPLTELRAAFHREDEALPNLGPGRERAAAGRLLQRFTPAQLVAFWAAVRAGAYGDSFLRSHLTLRHVANNEYVADWLALGEAAARSQADAEERAARHAAEATARFTRSAAAMDALRLPGAAPPAPEAPAGMTTLAIRTEMLRVPPRQRGSPEVEDRIAALRTELRLREAVSPRAPPSNSGPGPPVPAATRPA